MSYHLIPEDPGRLFQPRFHVEEHINRDVAQRQRAERGFVLGGVLQGQLILPVKRRLVDRPLYGDGLVLENRWSPI